MRRPHKWRSYLLLHISLNIGIEMGVWSFRLEVCAHAVGNLILVLTSALDHLDYGEPISILTSVAAL
jgi:hypothetical protein